MRRSARSLVNEVIDRSFELLGGADRGSEELVLTGQVGPADAFGLAATFHDDEGVDAPSLEIGTERLHLREADNLDAPSEEVLSEAVCFV